MGLFDKLSGRSKSSAYPKPINDLDFEEKVLASDIPVVVEFSTSTCPSCHVMIGLLKEIADEYDGRVRVFTANSSYCPRVSQELKIMAVPTVITFAKGKALGRVQGLIPIVEIRKLYDSLISK